jgi:hypothetical protein
LVLLLRARISGVAKNWVYMSQYQPKFWRNISSGYFLHAGFLLGLFFGPEDGGDMFLRNVGWFLKDYMVLYRVKGNFSHIPNDTL